MWLCQSQRSFNDLAKTALVTWFLVLAMTMCQAKPVDLVTAVADNDNNTELAAAGADSAPAPLSISFHDSKSAYGQWDLAVAHGDNISLITFDNRSSGDGRRSSIQEILIPFPANSIASTVYNNAAADAGLSIDPSTSASPLTSPSRPFGQIDYITTDSERQLIFYTYLYEQPASYKQRAIRYRDLNAFSLVTNESVRLVHAINNNATFDDLLYSDNTLYWIDAKSKHIMQLRLDPAASTAVPAGQPSPVVTLTHVPGRHVTFDGLALDPSTRHVYYGAWSSPSFGKSAIYYFDGNSSRLLLSENIHSPTSLMVTPDSHLYWVNKPTGSQYAIERVKLTAADDSAIRATREQIYTGQRQHWFSFMISCTKPGSNIFYTDTMSRSLYQVDTISKEQVLLKKYYPNIPQGLAASHPAWTSEANPLCSFPSRLSTSLSATAKVLSTTTLPSSSSSISTSTEISAIANLNTNTNGPNASANVDNQIVFYFCSPTDDFGTRCFNGGSCISSDSDVDVARTHCLCTPEWTGPTCEISIYNSANAKDLRSLSLQPTLEIGTNAEDDFESVYLTAIVAMAIVVALLVLVVGILIIKVCLLTRKPKIRRRVIVSRNNRAAGPKARGPDAGGQTVCELIDIENCCNMNICETPCYESGIMKTNNDKNNLGSASDVSVQITDDDNQQLIE